MKFSENDLQVEVVIDNEKQMLADPPQVQKEPNEWLPRIRGLSLLLCPVCEDIGPPVDQVSIDEHRRRAENIVQRENNNDLDSINRCLARYDAI